MDAAPGRYRSVLGFELIDGPVEPVPTDPQAARISTIYGPAWTRICQAHLATAAVRGPVRGGGAAPAARSPLMCQVLNRSQEIAVHHFVVTCVHPDPVGWKRHLDAHLQWIIGQVEAGTLPASGPTTGRDERTALLVFTASDEAAVRCLVETDPYTRNGQVAELTVTRWDPIFGVLAGRSSRAGLTDDELLDRMHATT
jgi:uncharacterized protein